MLVSTFNIHFSKVGHIVFLRTNNKLFFVKISDMVNFFLYLLSLDALDCYPEYSFMQKAFGEKGT